jgi:hypothetical protein
MRANANNQLGEAIRKQRSQRAGRRERAITALCRGLRQKIIAPKFFTATSPKSRNLSTAQTFVPIAELIIMTTLSRRALVSWLFLQLVIFVGLLLLGSLEAAPSGQCKNDTEAIDDSTLTLLDPKNECLE